MAADAYLLDLAETSDSTPILRLYGWDRPSITIGFHQRLERALRVPQLGDTPVVRRVTGGRALLHDDREITYAVAGDFRRFPMLGQSLHESYHKIAEAIVAFYRGIGWAAYVSRRDDPVPLGRPSAVQKGCYAAVSQHEIVVGRQKIAAGSQRRTRYTLLQHGAIRIAPPQFHPAIVNPPQSEESEQLPEVKERRESLVQILCHALEMTFGIRLESEPFSCPEKTVISMRLEEFKNMNPQ